MLFVVLCPGLVSCKKEDLGGMGLFHFGKNLKSRNSVLNVYSGCSVELDLHEGKNGEWTLV